MVKADCIDRATLSKGENRSPAISGGDDVAERDLKAATPCFEEEVLIGHPRFCNSDLDGWMACTNLSGVVVRNSPRATMRIAPDSPYNRGSF